MVGLLCGAVSALAPPSVLAATAPPLYWSAPEAIDTNQIDSISCPSTTLCVGVDYRGYVVASSDPTGGVSAWSSARIESAPEPAYRAPNALYGVSCAPPAGSLCVAVGEGGTFVSDDPTAGPSAWTQPGGVPEDSVSCPSASKCIVGSGTRGEVSISSDPTGGAGAWSTSEVDGGHPITGLSCPTEPLCVGVDEAGDVLASTHPFDGVDAWTFTHVASYLSGISCSSASLCVAIGGSEVIASTDPTGGAGAWVSEGAPAQNESLHQVSCAASGLCIASGENGVVVESADPTGGPAAWTSTGGLDGTNSMSGVACASPSLALRPTKHS
jgi:hypothetical protein